MVFPRGAVAAAAARTTRWGRRAAPYALPTFLARHAFRAEAARTKPVDPLPSSLPAVNLAALLAAAGGRATLVPSPLPALTMALPAGGSLQHSQLARLCEQLCADSAAAAAAAVKAAAAGNALLGALGSSGSGSSAQELLLGQLVLQDMQLLQRMQDNVLLQLRIVHAGCALASAPGATQMQPLQPLQLVDQLLAQLVSGGGSGMLTPADTGAAAQGAMMQPALALQLQWAALAQQQQPPLPDGRRSAPPLPPAGNQQQVVTASKPAEHDSSSGGLQQLQGLFAPLQSQPPSAGTGSSLRTVRPLAATIGGGGTDASGGQSLESQLIAALCLLRGFGKDAALEPPSVFSEQTAGRGSSAAAADGNGGAAGVAVGASSPTAAIQKAPAAGQPAAHPAG